MTVIERDRLLNALARALERCEVADDPTGAADEAAAILREVVALDATEVHPPGAVEALRDLLAEVKKPDQDDEPFERAEAIVRDATIRRGE